MKKKQVKKSMKLDPALLNSSNLRLLSSNDSPIRMEIKRQMMGHKPQMKQTPSI